MGRHKIWTGEEEESITKLMPTKSSWKAILVPQRKRKRDKSKVVGRKTEARVSTKCPKVKCNKICQSWMMFCCKMHSLKKKMLMAPRWKQQLASSSLLQMLACPESRWISASQNLPRSSQLPERRSGPRGGDLAALQQQGTRPKSLSLHCCSSPHSYCPLLPPPLLFLAFITAPSVSFCLWPSGMRRFNFLLFDNSELLVTQSNHTALYFN